MAGTMEGEVQIQHEILDCFTGLYKPGKGKNYLSIYTESTDNGQKATHTKGHESTRNKLDLDKVKLEQCIISNI